MNPYLENAFGIIKAFPDAIKAGQVLWDKLKPTPKAIVDHPTDGILGNTFYSDDYKFAISIPSDDWWFWRPSIAFLLTMGPAFNRPTSGTPIVIFSKQVINLFRSHIMITVEEVGQYTNIREMIDLSCLLIRGSGITIEEADIILDESNQSAMFGFTQPMPFDNVLCTVMHCHLVNGSFYTLTAMYAVTSNKNKKPSGPLQEILNSFKLIKEED